MHQDHEYVATASDNEPFILAVLLLLLLFLLDMGLRTIVAEKSHMLRPKRALAF